MTKAGAAGKFPSDPQGGDSIYETCAALYPQSNTTDGKPPPPFAYYFDSTGGKTQCVPMDQPYGKAPETLYSDATQIADRFNVTGLNLEFGSTHACPSDPARNLTLQVTNMCDKSMDSASHAAQTRVGSDACNVTVEYSSHQGCPDFSLGLFIAFVA